MAKRLLPYLIGLFALALRLWGIRWGLPNADHAFSYHTDETIVLSSSLACHPLLLLLDPGYYAYGCLVPLVNGLFLDLGAWSGLVQPASTSPSALLTCRLVTALFGAATCPVLFLAGKKLYNPTAGAVAAALYAVAPLAVQHAHFATVDVHATFWVALCLAAVGQVNHPADATPTTLKRRFKGFFWAGLFAGLAAAAKYNAGIIVLAPLAAATLTGSRLRAVGVTLTGALLGFVVGCPPLISNPGGMLAGLLREAEISRTDHGGIFAGLPPAFVTQPLQSIHTLGLLLPLSVGVGLLFALKRRSRSDWILLAFALPYFLVIGSSKAIYARYSLPLLPPLFLLVGALVPRVDRKHGIWALSAIAMSALPSSIHSGILNREMTLPDTRERALAWIREQNFQKIGFATGPWHYHPPLIPELTHPRPDKAREAAAATSNLLPADGEWNVEQLKTEDPDAVVLSEAEYVRAARSKDPKAQAFFEALKDNERQEFKPADAWNRVTPLKLPARWLPYDMGYPSPSIVVFFRR
jgi:hypothetical protein